MKSKEIVVMRGRCPFCSTKMEQLGSFNYSFMGPEFKISFYGCKTCRRLWQWKEGTYGFPPEMTDVAAKLRQIERSMGIAT